MVSVQLLICPNQKPVNIFHIYTCSTHIHLYTNDIFQPTDRLEEFWYNVLEYLHGQLAWRIRPETRAI
jgi:hypothetical protein